MADPKDYRQRSADVILAGEDDIDRQRLKKTRPDWFKGGKHTQESIMRGLEEAEVSEKGPIGRVVNRLKTNVMGSAVDNELAKEREEERKAKGMKKGGSVKSSASKRADGIAQRGKTRGKIC